MMTTAVVASPAAAFEFLCGRGKCLGEHEKSLSVTGTEINVLDGMTNEGACVHRRSVCQMMMIAG